MQNIANNLRRVNMAISDYEHKYHRPAHSVKLLAVSKGKSSEEILEAYAAGQRAFGENYLQEALLKMTALAQQSIEWHFIGKIQTNKTKKIAEHFAWVHSVDDMKIAKRLNDQRPAHLPPLNICIEVNISEQTTKSGIHANDMTLFAKYCTSLTRLKLRGLMAIPEEHHDFAKQRALCHQLSVLARGLRQAGFPIDTLSMGMSHDMEAAIAEGATMVRVGRAIFGPRE